jgi:hypothetical protein
MKRLTTAAFYLAALDKVLDYAHKCSGVWLMAFVIFCFRSLSKPFSLDGVGHRLRQIVHILFSIQNIDSDVCFRWRGLILTHNNFS